MKAIRGWNTRSFVAVDEGTGEVLEPAHVKDYFTQLITRTTDIVSKWLTDVSLQERVRDGDKASVKAAEMARQLNIGSSKDMPDGFPQPYRVLKMAQDNYITTIRSFLNSPVENKQSPRVGRWLRFGAADRQITSITREGNALVWRVLGQDNTWWLVSFAFPERFGVPVKICQPMVRLDRDGELIITLTCEYEVPKVSHTEESYLGVDLGRVVPYVAALTNQKGDVVSLHYPSEQIMGTHRKQVTAKRQGADLARKIAQYEALGLVDKATKAREEKERQLAAVRRKDLAIAKTTGRELVILAKHNNAALGMEDLRWVKRSGRWKHGITNNWVEHFARFDTVRTTRVNPAYSSSTCPCCEDTTATYQTGRDIRCKACRVRVDRDEAASIEMSRRTRKKMVPTPKRPPNKKKARVSEEVSDTSETKSLVAPPESRVQEGGACSHGQGTSKDQHGKPTKYLDYRLT